MSLNYPGFKADTPGKRRMLADVFKKREEIALQLRSQGWTLEAIGMVLGIRRERIRQIVMGGAR